GSPLTEPLRAVVGYEGAYTVNKFLPAWTQNFGGWYQSANRTYTMYPIVGNGQLGMVDTLTATDPITGKASTSTPIATPFSGTAGNRWDNPKLTLTFPNNASDSAYASKVTVTNNTQTCLTFISVWTSTPVIDGDNDGLLNVWETKGLHLNPGSGGYP